MEQLSIKISIANREYPLKISKSEEYAVQKAAEIINAKISMLEENYSVSDKQDLLAMCAIQIAAESIGSANPVIDNIAEKLSEIDGLITGYIAQENKDRSLR